MKYLFLLIALSFATTGFAQTTTTEDKREVKVVKDSAGAEVTTSHTETTVDEITPRNNMIVVNPLKFFVFYNLSYFHKVSDHIALGGGLQVPSFSGISGAGGNAEVRFYPGKHNLRGFYVAPNVSFNYVTVQESSYDPVTGDYSGTHSTKATATSVGVLIGWQWFPGDDFAIGLGIGIDNYWLSGSNDSYVGNVSGIDGRVPAFRFDIGYGW